MEIYKKGQGTVVRVCAYLAAFLLLFYGCASLYGAFLSTRWGYTLLLPVESLHLNIRWALVPCAVVFVVLGYLIHRYFNKDRQADFLIETEGELKKVSWPPRKDFLSASMVVLVLVVAISLFLYAVDWMLVRILGGLGLGI